MSGDRPWWQPEGHGETWSWGAFPCCLGFVAVFILMGGCCAGMALRNIFT